MNILITAAATASSYRLQREIGEGSFIFADSCDLPQVMVRDRSFIKIPDAKTPSFAHLLLTTCLDLNVQKVFPLRKAEIKALSEARLLFDEYGIKVIVPLLPKLETLLTATNTGGQLIIKEEERHDNSFIEVDRGVILFNAGADPEVQLLSID